MKTVSAADLSRHNYLLSQFSAFPIAGSKHWDIRFAGELPRATTFKAAVTAAMRAAGLSTNAGPVDVDDTLAHQMTYVANLFVAASPEAVAVPDCAPGHEVQYHFLCTKSFRVAKESVPAEIVIATAAYKPPTPIAGVRDDASEIYRLLHASLRKNCDSTPTSAMYNVMSIIDQETRVEVVAVVRTALSAAPFTAAEDVVGAVKSALLNEDVLGKTAGMSAVHCIAKLFDARDWMGFLNYLIVWKGEVATEA